MTIAEGLFLICLYFIFSRFILTCSYVFIFCFDFEKYSEVCTCTWIPVLGECIALFIAVVFIAFLVDTRTAPLARAIKTRLKK